MLNLTLKHDPGLIKPNEAPIAKTPMDAAVALNKGTVPVNLIETSLKSDVYKLAVLNILTDGITQPGGREEILRTLVKQHNSMEDGEGTRLIAEYISVLSFAWNETALATKAVLKTKPQVASSLLKQVAVKLQENVKSDEFRIDFIRDTVDCQSMYLNNVMHNLFI